MESINYVTIQKKPGWLFYDVWIGKQCLMNITMENARNKHYLVNKRCAMKALNQNSAWQTYTTFPSHFYFHSLLTGMSPDAHEIETIDWIKKIIADTEHRYQSASIKHPFTWPHNFHAFSQSRHQAASLSDGGTLECIKLTWLLEK